MMLNSDVLHKLFTYSSHIRSLIFNDFVMHVSDKTPLEKSLDVSSEYTG